MSSTNLFHFKVGCEAACNIFDCSTNFTEAGEAVHKIYNTNKQEVVKKRRARHS